MLSSHDALWFSPDGKNLAFLKFNETLVPEYRLQKYESQRSSIYPEELAVKYPKPGYPNPTVTLHIASTTKDANVNSVKSDHAVLFNSAAKLFADDDRLIVEVKWSAAHDTTTTATNHPLLTRIMNRVQDIQHIFLISATTSIAVDPTSKKEVYGQEWKGELVRNETNKDNAWFQQLQPIRMLKNGGIGNSYLELKETEAGFTHIAYYDDFNATQPARWLTTGEWEVTDISSIDEEKGIVYFISTEEGSIQRHLYSVHMDAANTKKKLTPPSNIPHTAVLPELEWPPASTPIVKNSTDAISTTNEVLNGEKLLRLRRRHDDGDDIYNNLRSRSPAPRPFPIPPPDKQLGVIGFWEARFSPKSKYYHLRYTGPDVPFSKIIGVETSKGETEKRRVLIYDLKLIFLQKDFNHDMEGWGGDKARRGIQFYNLPLTKYLTIKNAVGDDINVKLTTPPGYDPTGTTQKYPVLLRVYGGPNSQMVQATYEFGFMSAVANMGVVVLVVDGRGTGYKGRAFRACVNRQLGSVEVEDQIAAGKWAAALPFVDATRIGIWGWSYGGYMAAKVLEADSGVFSMAMSVAPVTDWLFYGTNTERGRRGDDWRHWEMEYEDEKLVLTPLPPLLLSQKTQSTLNAI